MNSEYFNFYPMQKSRDCALRSSNINFANDTIAIVDITRIFLDGNKVLRWNSEFT